jgi:hypothetical protein
MNATNEPTRTTICHSWARAERNPTIGVGRRVARTLYASCLAFLLFMCVIVYLQSTAVVSWMLP